MKLVVTFFSFFLLPSALLALSTDKSASVSQEYLDGTDLIYEDTPNLPPQYTGMDYSLTSSEWNAKLSEWPVFLQHPSDMFIVKNEPVQLICRASPAIQIYFKCNGLWVRAGLHQHSEGVERDTKYREAQIEITREEVERFEEHFSQDEGLSSSPEANFWCQCVAWSDSEQVESKRAMIRVSYLRKLFVREPLSQTVPLGKSVQLDCGPPLGLPEPYVYWLKGEERLDTSPGGGNNVLQTISGSLIINQVGPSDVGNYSCIAKNVAGRRKSATAQIDIEAPGKWDSWSDWSACQSAILCKGGVEKRERGCIHPVSGLTLLSLQCQDGASIETRPCLPKDCQPKATYSKVIPAKQNLNKTSALPRDCIGLSSDLCDKYGTDIADPPPLDGSSQIKQYNAIYVYIVVIVTALFVILVSSILIFVFYRKSRIYGVRRQPGSGYPNSGYKRGSVMMTKDSESELATTVLAHQPDVTFGTSGTWSRSNPLSPGYPHYTPLFVSTGETFSQADKLMLPSVLYPYTPLSVSGGSLQLPVHHANPYGTRLIGSFSALEGISGYPTLPVLSMNGNSLADYHGTSTPDHYSHIPTDTSGTPLPVMYDIQPLDGTTDSCWMRNNYLSPKCQKYERVSSSSGEDEMGDKPNESTTTESDHSNSTDRNQQANRQLKDVEMPEIGINEMNLKPQITMNQKQLLDSISSLPHKALLDPGLSVIGQITHLGGRLSLPHHGVSLLIPRGCIPVGRPQLIYLSVCANDQEKPKLPIGGTILSSMVIVGPLECPLNKPVILSMDHCAKHPFTNWTVSVLGGSQSEVGNCWQCIDLVGEESLSPVFCQLDENKAFLMMDHFHSMYCIVGKSKQGHKATKRLRLALFSRAELLTEYPLRLYCVEDISSSMQRILAGEVHLGGFLMDHPKVLDLGDNGHVVRFSIPHISQGWNATSNFQEIAFDQIWSSVDSLLCATFTLKQIDNHQAPDGLHCSIQVQQHTSSNQLNLQLNTGCVLPPHQFPESSQDGVVDPPGLVFRLPPHVRIKIQEALDSPLYSGNDWRMLAKILNMESILGHLATKSCPTERVLDLWEARHREDSSLRQLLSSLEAIGHPELATFTEVEVGKRWR